MARLADRTEFGIPMRGKEASYRASTGRVCETAGCETILSTYNGSGLCWLHGPVTYKPARETRPRR